MDIPHVLDNISIPKFDLNNSIHIKLSELSEQAHNAANKGEKLNKIEEAIDFQAAKLWNLNEQELKDIQRSLEELEGTKDVESAE